MQQQIPHKRYKLTFSFLQKLYIQISSILDLGVENPLPK
jgi:hypothetical protein